MGDQPSKQQQIEGAQSSSVDKQHHEVETSPRQDKMLVRVQGGVESSVFHADVVDQRTSNLTRIQNNYFHGSQPHSSGQANTIEEEQLFKEEVKNSLDRRAKEIVGKWILPIELDLAIKYEQLELKTGLQRSFPNLDEEGHYHRRKDFEELIMRPCQGDISLEKVFDRALQRAIAEAKKRTKNKEARTKHVNRHGNIVAIVGQAGIGKTTLAQRMVELILEDKVLHNNEYIFFVSFREVEFSTECTLFDFITTGCDLKLSQKFDRMLKPWIDDLQDNPNVAFIFDGLDEANTDGLSVRNNRNPRQMNCKPDAFVRDIFCGKIFPLAKKLVTSRPRQFFELDPGYRPQYVVDILGLNKTSQEKLVKQICQDNFEMVQEFLRDHPDVSSSLYVPVNCIIVFAILSMTASDDGRITAHSLTDIFVQALDHFLRSDHIRGKANEIWKLAVLAWKGFLNRKIIFNQADIKSAEISDEAFQAFLLTITNRNLCFSILDGDKRSSFSHLIWQELFAAINAIFLLPVDELKLHLDRLTDPLWEVVSKFMFGLCHPAVREKVRGILPPEQMKDLIVKRKELHDLIVKLMKQISEAKAMERKRNTLLLQLCSWIQEAGDPKLDAIVVQHFPREINLEGSMLPTDVSNLIYAMKAAKQPISLEVDGRRVRFVQDSFQRLLKGLATLPTKMEKVCLDKMEIGNNDAASLGVALANIKALRLYSCSFRGPSMATILAKIALLPEPMEKLDLSHTVSVVHYSKFLVDSLESVRALCLREGILNPQLINAIAEKIASLPRQMEELDFSENVIDDDAATSLARALPNVNFLHLQSCQLSSYAMTTILKKISSLSRPMGGFAVGSNVIKDDVAEPLGNAVALIKSLRLNSCDLSSCTVSSISMMISSLTQPMHLLDLSDNAIDDDAAVSLAYAISNIKNLNLASCMLSAYAVRTVLIPIISLSEPMDELNLNWIGIDNDVVGTLTRVVAKIKKLNVFGCSLSNDAISRIKLECSLHGCEMVCE